MLGDGQDSGLWNTGNGWAAHGSLRVLATMKNSDFAGDFTSEMADLTAWVQEILGAAFQKIKVSAYGFCSRVAVARARCDLLRR